MPRCLGCRASRVDVARGPGKGARTAPLGSGVYFPGAGSLLHAAATGATLRTRFGLEKAPAFGYRFGSPISKSLL
jgi:hypothetical protein